MPDLHEITPQHALIQGVIGSELAHDLGVVNSEIRIMAMGAVAMEQEAPRTLNAAYKDFMAVLPGVRFLRLSYFRNSVERLPEESRVIEVSSDNQSIGERTVGLTDVGLRQAGLGGHLLDLSFKSNVALRRLLGGTLRRALPDGTTPPTPQERYLRLGAFFGNRKHPVLFDSLLEAPVLAPQSRGGLVDRIDVWHEGGILRRERPDTTNPGAPYKWKFSEKGRVAFQGLVDIVERYSTDSESSTQQGLDLLSEYYDNPDKRRVLPHLFRRDYIASGSDKKGDVVELDQALRQGLSDVEPDKTLTTTEIAERIGRDSITPVSLHRVTWLAGADSPLTYEGHDGRTTTWRVLPARPTVAEHYRNT